MAKKHKNQLPGQLQTKATEEKNEIVSTVGKQYFMKKGHGKISFGGQIVIGVEFRKNQKTKKVEEIRLPISEKNLALFSESQKLQYLELL